jgi:hypothetical protein
MYVEATSDKKNMAESMDDLQDARSDNGRQYAEPDYYWDPGVAPRDQNIEAILRLCSALLSELCVSFCLFPFHSGRVRHLAYH